MDANVGVGFAVPAPAVQAVTAGLLANGHVEHAWLGVQLATIDPSVTGLDLPSHGAEVAKVVPGSPAAKAGLHAATRQLTVDGEGVPVGGDTIVSLNGKSVSAPRRWRTPSPSESRATW